MREKQNLSTYQQQIHLDQNHRIRKNPHLLLFSQLRRHNTEQEGLKFLMNAY